MTAVEELQDTTSGFGWPVSLKFIDVENMYFLRFKLLLSYLELKSKSGNMALNSLTSFFVKMVSIVFVVKPILLPTSGLRPDLCHHVYCLSSTHNTCLLSW